MVSISQNFNFMYGYKYLNETMKPRNSELAE